MLAFVINNVFNWQFWLGVLLTILIFLWIFFGGKECEYVGLKPLAVNVDSCKYVDKSTYYKAERSNRNAKKQYSTRSVDNTPSLPKRSKKKKKVRFTNDSSRGEPTFLSKPEPTFSISSEQVDDVDVSVTDYVCSYEAKSPRSMALGDHKIWTNNRRSKGEQLCKKVIEEIYQKLFYTVRPSFLKNPESGRNLEIDLYNDELRLGVEFQGEQHYKWPNFTNCSHQDFINQLRRDNWKVDRCDEEGIYLITVPYNVGLEYEKIKEFIEYYLPENVRKREVDQ